jgi:hypothetical protein
MLTVLPMNCLNLPARLKPIANGRGLLQRRAVGVVSPTGDG